MLPLRTVLLASALLLTAVAVAPTASATTCAFEPGELEPVVCGVVGIALCLVGNSLPKPDLKGIFLCDFVLP